MPDPMQTWMEGLKQRGLSDEEITKLCTASAVTGSAALYLLLASTLTEEDMNEVEAIADEAAAKLKAEELFFKRAGMSIDDLVARIQNNAAQQSAQS